MKGLAGREARSRSVVSAAGTGAKRRSPASRTTCDDERALARRGCCPYHNYSGLNGWTAGLLSDVRSGPRRLVPARMDVRG